jgi:hypothetical protein
MLNKIDALLNRFTMYRVVLYSLVIYIVAAFILTLTGTIGVSATGIALSLLVLLLVTYATNHGLARALNVSTNSESWLITALILVCILPPPTTVSKVAAVALTGVLAMASKFFLKWRGVNLFNPAAIAVFVVSLANIVPATWWIGTPAMAPFTVLFGLLILRKIRRFSLFIAFLAAAAIIAVYVGPILGNDALAGTLKNTFLSGPLIFMGTIMLTEPSTLPVGRLYQVLYGLLVGTVFSSELGVGRLTSTPQVALIVGNIFTIVAVQRFGAQLALKRRTQIGPNLYDFAFSLPTDCDLPFTPGQYLEWTLPHAKADSRGNRRTFSIASSPADSEVHLAIKTYEPSSTYKQALLKLEPGQTIRVAHPAGDFTLPRRRYWHHPFSQHDQALGECHRAAQYYPALPSC